MTDELHLVTTHGFWKTRWMVAFVDLSAEQAYPFSRGRLMWLDVNDGAGAHHVKFSSYRVLR